MPIYEFVCNNCNKTFEKLFLKIQDTPSEIKCPNCGNIAKKTVSLSTFKLKGFGWAFDGYDVTSNSVKNNKAEGKEKWTQKQKEIKQKREEINRKKSKLGLI